LLKAVARQLDAKHFVGTDEPEECMFLFDSTMVSISFWMFAPVFSYLRWYLRQDQSHPYRAYREHLQLFQDEAPHRRLTLKAPLHTGNLDALFGALPEALVIQTHRDPVPIVASVNSLFYTFHSVISDHVDLRRMAATNAELLAGSITDNLQARERWRDRILDVRYKDLLADPITTVRLIHDRFDLGWSHGYEEHLRRHLADRPQHRHGVHTYAAEEFGLTDELVAARFKEYRERFIDDG
jgi:hypothetical protein